ncbi:MAG TPA: hypothetical protein VI911_12165 [Patescibacteria group bacterium]|nr:hypothetical protein [Patescibacteria group bacterium]
MKIYIHKRGDEIIVTDYDYYLDTGYIRFSEYTVQVYDDHDFNRILEGYELVGEL